MRWTRWLTVAVAGAALIIATALFVRTGLEKSDQWASVLSFFVGTLSLALGLVQAARDARHSERARVNIHGDGNQIVRGNVKYKVINKAPLLQILTGRRYRR
jgi:hypothetical protein